MIPRPTLIVSVAAAAWVAATNGSNRRLYSRGSSPPAGYGVARLAGMWVCSGKNTDSNPSASARVASHAGRDRLVRGEDREPEVHAQSWVASVGSPSSSAAGELPGRRARRACAASPRGRRARGAAAGSTRRCALPPASGRRSSVARVDDRRRVRGGEPQAPPAARRRRPRRRPRAPTPRRSPRRAARAAARTAASARATSACTVPRSASVRCPPVGHLAAGQRDQVVERAAGDPEADRRDRQRQQPEQRERVERAGLRAAGRRARDGALGRDEARRRARCRGCRWRAGPSRARCRGS